MIAPEPVRVVTPEVAAAARAWPPSGPRRRCPPADGRPAVRPPPVGVGRARRPGASSGRGCADVAARAEAAGFSSVWVMDHLRQIPQVGRAWEDMPESTATLGYLAAATSYHRARVPRELRDVPQRRAPRRRSWRRSTSSPAGARGAGSAPAGSRRSTSATAGRSRRPPSGSTSLEDALQLLPMMWGPGSKPFHGRRIDVPETICYPRPLRATGADPRRRVRRAAHAAAGGPLRGRVQPHGRRRRGGGEARRCCTATAPRSAATRRPVEVTHLSTALVAARRRRAGGRRRAATAAARCRAVDAAGEPGDRSRTTCCASSALRAAGVSHVIVSLAGVWDSAAVERFGAVIAASA